VAEPKTRQDYLDIADKALRQAVLHAEIAANTAYGTTRHTETQAHAAAGALWADIARSAAVLAADLPENTTEDTHV
jgi:hypothetical protein